MKIPQYLIEIQHAVTIVMNEIYREQSEVDRLGQELKKLQDTTEDGYARASFLALNPELDDEGLGTAIHWETYFGSDKERCHKSVEVKTAMARVLAHEFSVTALCGSLLQYAKQGLSLHFGKKRNGCPDGRLVGGVTLHEVIWQARNQATHWEDDSFHPATIRCFDTLAQKVDPVFAEYTSRSMAYEIVRILKWRSPEDFSNDMRLFVSAP